MFVLGFTVVFVLLGLHHHRRRQRALPQPGDPHPHLRRSRAPDGAATSRVRSSSPRRACTRSSASTRTSTASARWRRRSRAPRSASAGQPCIGPVLGAVLGFAAVGDNIARSTLLLVAYSLGLGVSFLAVGLAMGKLTRTLDWFKRHFARDHVGLGRDPRGVRRHPAHRLAADADRAHVRRAPFERVRLARRRANRTRSNGACRTCARSASAGSRSTG